MASAIDMGAQVEVLMKSEEALMVEELKMVEKTTLAVNHLLVGEVDMLVMKVVVEAEVGVEVMELMEAEEP